ncbi:MAG: hypothetical protein VX378_11700 [Pseudomonadota bacterium]|nr:hypothetical protein [Pseudomonadota bacterium]
MELTMGWIIGLAFALGFSAGFGAVAGYHAALIVDAGFGWMVRRVQKGKAPKRREPVRGCAVTPQAAPILQEGLRTIAGGNGGKKC